MAARGPSPLFSRLIHRIYFNNSAVAHFFSQRARPAGILLVLLIPITWTLMPMYSLGPVYQLRGMIFAMLTISILWLLFRKAKVTTTRRLPRLATAGEPLQYHIIIHNTGKRTVSGANFLEMVPDNRPSRELFTNSREPGEEHRNIFDRTFCFYRWEWLQKSLTLFSSKPSSFIRPLAPGEHTKIPLTIVPKKRGIIILRDLRIFLPDPLGIFQRCSSAHSSEDKLIVLPHRYRIPLQVRINSSFFHTAIAYPSYTSLAAPASNWVAKPYQIPLVNREISPVFVSIAQEIHFVIFTGKAGPAQASRSSKNMRMFFSLGMASSSIPSPPPSRQIYLKKPFQ